MTSSLDAGSLDTDRMVQAADRASELLKSLGNRNRLLILCQLVAGERSVGDLAGLLGLRDSTVSQHLALLRRDGLVAARREGQTMWYSIASTPARQVLDVLYRHYCQPSPPQHEQTAAAPLSPTPVAEETP